MKQGPPKSSVLSPVLFPFYINELAKKLPNLKFKMCPFWLQDQVCWRQRPAIVGEIILWHFSPLNLILLNETLR